MKKKGCTSLLVEDRNEDLMKVFDRLVTRYGREMSITRIYDMVAISPAPRYYVTVKAVLDTYSRYFGKNKQIPVNRMSKAGAMYRDIINRALALRKEGMTMPAAVAKVVYGRAPSFFLSGRTVKNIITGMERCRKRR